MTLEWAKFTYTNQKGEKKMTIWKIMSGNSVHQKTSLRIAV